MDISITKSGDGTYELAFDDTKISLSSAEIKVLLLQATKVLLPEEGQTGKPEENAKEFAARFKIANDVGIQNFIRDAEQEDLLVLLKVIESDKAVLQRFYKNMSERLQKMISEDLAFKFKDEVTPDKVSSALGNLRRTASALEKKGGLVFDDE